jgi:hypothetical protein
MTLCEVIHLATAFELYWPFLAYCLAVLWAYSRFLWMPSGMQNDLLSFNRQLKSLHSTAIGQMLIKIICLWVLGGSILLSIGTWVCGVGN